VEQRSLRPTTHVASDRGCKKVYKVLMRKFFEKQPLGNAKEELGR
jgi:hypothetical protein